MTPHVIGGGEVSLCGGRRGQEVRAGGPGRGDAGSSRMALGTVPEERCWVRGDACWDLGLRRCSSGGTEDTISPRIREAIPFASYSLPVQLGSKEHRAGGGEVAGGRAGDVIRNITGRTNRRVFTHSPQGTPLGSSHLRETL